jgi:hypothetical protein
VPIPWRSGGFLRPEWHLPRACCRPSAGPGSRRTLGSSQT